MKRLLLVAATLSLVAASGGGLSALANPPTPDNPAGHSHEILGVVPAHNQAKPGGGGRTSNNLSYHGGPVLLTNRTVAIYWAPSGAAFSANYQSVINGFFNNVALASGATSDVYGSDTQYYGPTGAKISTNSVWGGPIVMTNPYPGNGCTDNVAETNVCLSDAQLQAEVALAVPAPDPNTVYFLFTAKNVGSCAGNECAFSYYCAYHSSFTQGTNTWIYANQPYADTVPSACDAGQHPNNDDADATINVTSHEHNESITDWQGNAWYDRQGAENGDKCAWTFGTALGSTGGSNTAYNQVIGSGKYYLQQEWSNARSGCVLTGI